MSGEIPASLGDLPRLRDLRLENNRLAGAIPSELGGIASLRTLYISPNDFTGCVPESVRYIQESDVADLGLPFCQAAPAPAPTPTEPP